MKRITLTLTLLLASCVAAPATVSSAVPATETFAVPPSPNAETPSPEFRVPPTNAAWQIQYTGEINTALNVDVFNLDLFDTDPAMIADLRARGIFVMCYFSAGSFEDWRPDTNQFSEEVLGKDMEGWPGEKWLDIRRLDLLAPVMSERMDMAAQKGCDGVDPDNVNGYTNDTGYTLTYEDQLTFNIWLAESAHARGLSIGLKNDLEQIPELVSYFDWALNEQCFYYEECGLLLPFATAGKPVFTIEYELGASEFCEQAEKLGFNSIRKNWDLDEFIEACPLSPP